VTTVADTKTSPTKKGIVEGEVIGVPVVQSTTEETPAEADKTSAPVPNDAKPEQPPVRTVRPDTPIAQSLAAGAGAHEPADQDMFQPDGRLKEEEPATA
jgi:hypothetical protein